MKIKIIWKQYQGKLTIVFFDEVVKYPNIKSAIDDLEKRGFNWLKAYKAIEQVFIYGKYSGIEFTQEELSSEAEKTSMRGL